MRPTSSGTRKPYGGTTRGLVLALDVGTTFSGVSYAILEPGEVPKIHGVTRFPGQEHVAGNSKIPSIMYYDQSGEMKAAGAEAENVTTMALAEDEGWVKTELFKLRLRPKTMKLKMNGMRLAPLPRNKTAVDVFGDFLAYLFRCTRSFIVDTHANGPALWNAVEHDIQLVLSHPNGWEGAQQTKMRRAAVYGGLIPDTDEGRSRIRFVTEGEASLHACVLNGLAADVLSNPSGHGFIVADAGGGTLDISSYAIKATAPLVIEEIAPPDCVFAGSVFVSRRARAYFEEKLKKSKYGTPDSLDHITKRFDETTKRLFRSDKELQFVPFGSPLDKDPTVGIRSGQLKLTGTEVAALFEPSIQAAVASIQAQIEGSGGAVKSVWLVGGFAASPWLFAQLQERLARYGVAVSRPDTQTSKAVADGAIGFYCDHHVSARVSKFMYGVEYLREFDEKDEEHVARRHRLFELPSGPKLLPDAFDCILSRGVKVKESTVFSRKYCTEVTNLSTLSVFEVEIWCYRGGNTIPKWILRNAEHFSTLCHVRADLSPLAGSATAKQGKNGKTYWTIVFNIEIHFGLTEFRARIKWIDNGKTKYGPASIVYNESGHRAEDDEPDESLEDNITVGTAPSDARSHTSPKPASRAPTASNSRSAASSVYASPRQTADTSRGLDREISMTRSSSGRSAHSTIDKGKARELMPDIPSASKPMRDHDRTLNTSGRSMDSIRSGSTRLADTLNSVWGPSSHQTPMGSPVVELPTPLEPSRAATPRAVSRPPTIHEDVPFAQSVRELTPKEVSKAPSPGEPSKAPTPREPSKPPTPKDEPKELSKAPTPREASKAPTPRELPKELSKPPTPKEASKAPTPKEASKAPTPREPPKELEKVSTPKEASKAPTPKGASKAPTPKEVSRVATPKAVSKAPTPQPGSKVPTPKAQSIIGTPKSQPAADIPAEEKVEERQPEAASTETAPAVAEESAAATEPPAEESAAATEPSADTVDVLPVEAAKAPTEAEVFGELSEPAADSATGSGLASLWGAPHDVGSLGTTAGGFSDFLSGTGWGSKRNSANLTGGGSWGASGGISFGSGLFGGSPQGSDSAKKAAAEAEEQKKKDEAQKAEEESKTAEEDAKRKQEEEEAKKKEGEEAARQAEENKEAEEEAARKKAEDEAAQKKADEEEAAKKAAEEKAVEEAKKAAEDVAAAEAKKAADEEEAKKAGEAAKVEEAKRAEEEEAARKKAEEEEAAKKAAEEEEAKKKAEEEKKTSKTTTPAAMSRAPSGAATPASGGKQSKNAKKNAKKKKKKGKGAGGDEKEDEEEGGEDVPVTPGGAGNDDDEGWDMVGK